MTIDLELVADLRASIATVAAELTARRQRAEAIERGRQSVTDRIPIGFKTGHQAVSNAAGLAVIDLRGPDQSRKWEIRRLWIGGATANATPAGTAYAFAAAGNPDSAQTADLSGLNVRDFTNVALPQKAFYSAEQFTLEYPERLWVVIIGGGSTVQFAANAGGLDYPIILGARAAEFL